MSKGFLHRAERSLLVGALAGIVAMATSVIHAHGHLAAQAATQHETVTSLLFHGFLAVALIVTGIVLAIASIAAARRGGGGRAPQRRTRREDW